MKKLIVKTLITLAALSSLAEGRIDWTKAQFENKYGKHTAVDNGKAGDITLYKYRSGKFTIYAGFHNGKCCCMSYTKSTYFSNEDVLAICKLNLQSDLRNRFDVRNLKDSRGDYKVAEWANAKHKVSFNLRSDQLMIVNIKELAASTKERRAKLSTSDTSGL